MLCRAHTFCLAPSFSWSKLHVLDTNQTTQSSCRRGSSYAFETAKKTNQKKPPREARWSFLGATLAGFDDLVTWTKVPKPGWAIWHCIKEG